MRQIGPTNLTDEGWVATDDELVACPRQADVEPFAGALES
jgi:hypothetical protein